MFNWDKFWNYYNAATKKRNQSKVSVMDRGMRNAWNQYWSKHCGGIGTLFVDDVFYGKDMTEYCKLAKTHMMSLGLSTAIADGVLKQLKQYCKDTK